MAFQFIEVVTAVTPFSLSVTEQIVPTVDIIHFHKGFFGDVAILFLDGPNHLLQLPLTWSRERLRLSLFLLHFAAYLFHDAFEHIYFLGDPINKNTLMKRNYNNVTILVSLPCYLYTGDLHGEVSKTP